MISGLLGSANSFAVRLLNEEQYGLQVYQF